MINIDHPGKIADFISSILNIKREEQQGILETLDVQKRMEQVLNLYKEGTGAAEYSEKNSAADK